MPSRVQEEARTFDSQYAHLNAEQKDAVDSLHGPVMVIAGPGTGKTEVLTMRIANLLRHDVPPNRILALTFTEAGAANMRRRLAELMGPDAYRVIISTFHGFANGVIRDNPDYFPKIIGAVSITEIDQVKIMRNIIDRQPLIALRSFGDRYYYLRDMVSAISDLKREGVTPERFAEIAASEKKVFFENPDLYNTSGKYEGRMKGKYSTAAKRVERNQELAMVYHEYQRLLTEARQYDYSDMIMYVMEALEESEQGDGTFLSFLRHLFDYFLIDEHQDTNDAQNRIIELLAGENSSPNIFVVGDEKQAIFRFQGASLANFHYFQERYPEVRLITLRSNYRSTQAILNAAHAVSPRKTALIAHAGYPEHPAHYAVLSSPDQEYYFIARKINELRDAGVVLENIAVLYRDNKDAPPIARALEKEGIPSSIESDQDVLGDEDIKKLLRILRAVQHFGKDWALAEAMNVEVLNLDPFEVYKVISMAYAKRKKVNDAIRSKAFLEEIGIATPEAFLTLSQKISSWKRASENKSAVDAFEDIVRDSGFLAYILARPGAPEVLVKLHALFDLLKSLVVREKNYTLQDFFSYLDLIEEHGLAVKSTDTTRIPGRVRLMTAHRSKGLEFDYVFVVHAVDRKWGSRRHQQLIVLPSGIYRASARVESILDTDANEDFSDDADERNVFYVALTRAKKEIFVTRSARDREGKEQLPTQFIAEINDDILVPYDGAQYEQAWFAHPEREYAEFPKRVPEFQALEFIRDRFDEQGLSVTALNNYLDCPWHYFYVNLVRIPEAPNKHLSFGNAIHTALKRYFDEFDKGKDPGNMALVKYFEESLEQEPMPVHEFEEVREKGRRALNGFFEEYHLHWIREAVNEQRLDGVLMLPEHGAVKLNGKLDRIEFLEEHAVRVIDYKTGKPKTRNEIEGITKASDGNYKRQLVFYKLLLLKEGNYTMKEAILQFIESDEKGNFHRETFLVEDSEVNELEAEIGRVAHEIRSGAFFEKGCNEDDCRYCELHRESLLK